MSAAPLMPKATAVWLVDNTALTFRQIADYCHLHELEVKGIADGDVAQGIKGLDPLAAGQLSREELEKAQADPGYRMKISESTVDIPVTRGRKGPRYTPVSRRQDRPDAIAWLLRYHPELPDSQIMKLVGTTKPTIQAIRDRTHWNSSNIKPVDPVSLSLCSQMDLDQAVAKAARKAAKLGKAVPVSPALATLLPASETTATNDMTSPDVPMEIAEPVAEAEEDITDADAFKDFDQAPAEPAEEDEAVDADSVFAKLKDLKPDLGEGEEDSDGDKE
ncbi:MAG: DUF1013 domain-containing protein [Rhizobiales bacterium]|nr:DUF1013 domain-containing protein [Hyphomicrobiales bacterium]